MNKINWNQVVKTTTTFLNAHKATILGGIGIGASVAAGVTAARAGYIHGSYDNAFGDLNKEQKKQVRKAYVLPAALELGAVGMLTASLILSEKKQKDMAAAYASLAAYISAYKIKMKEINQAECEEAIENNRPIGYTPEEKDILADQFAKDQVKYLTRESLPDDSEVLWFFDEESARWYKSTLVKQLYAEAAVNQQYQLDGYVTLAYYYDSLDPSLNDSAFYDTIGWDCETMQCDCDAYFIEFVHSRKQNPENGEWGWSIEALWGPTDSYYLQNNETLAFARSERMEEVSC